MEDLMDMDMSPLRPQNYLFSYELKANKDDHFKVDNDENAHQLSLRTVSLGAGAKDELHIVEAKAMNYEGSPIKVTLGLCILVAVEEDAESEDEEEEDVKLLSISGKHSAPGSGSKFPQKKVKLAADEDDDDDDDDFDDEEDEEKAPILTVAPKGNNQIQAAGCDLVLPRLTGIRPKKGLVKWTW
ncbi:Nucleophosmin [Camelus dromedarius]|uniref:Nucleophosmin n=1 Tax=Camelus dromedarius TaxID=9838 RepID=A0A5N4CY40_CAMDR|nr:Nucleophosmin [Camelus dromedarius]